jgi:hypothetical protein
MYTLRKGFVAHGSKVLRCNCSWGHEQMVLNSAILLEAGFNATSLTFCEVYSLDRENLDEACALYPSDCVIVRRAAVLVAVRTAARYLARRSSKEGSLGARNMTKAVTAEGEDAAAICQEQSRQMIRFAELLQESAEVLASVKTGSIGAPRTKVEMCFSSPLTGTTARSAGAEYAETPVSAPPAERRTDAALLTARKLLL